jgi:Xaa-Pro aminopeptidase
MDVHDCGPYKTPDGHPIALAPGMVLTIEPGLYIPQADDIPPCYRGIGIRIEDNIVVTDGDPWNLTSAVPKTPADLEGLK